MKELWTKAITNNDIIEAKKLIKLGIDINQFLSYPYPEYDLKETALHLAVNWHEDMVILLLSQPNIDINIQNASGKFPIENAFTYDCKDIFYLLLNHPTFDITCIGKLVKSAIEYNEPDFIEMIIDFLNKTKNIVTENFYIQNPTCRPGWTK